MMNNQSDSDDGPFFILTFVGDKLDPLVLTELMRPLTSYRPFRQGDPLGRAMAGKPVARAKTGVCNFSTNGHVKSPNPNDHLAFLLANITPKIESLRQIGENNDLSWECVFFGVEDECKDLPVLDQELLAQAKALNLPLRAERARGPDPMVRVSLVTD